LYVFIHENKITHAKIMDVDMIHGKYVWSWITIV
jgi:hypothetical protein